MRDLHTNPDGTVTALWQRREVHNARRGFFKNGKPCWPVEEPALVEWRNMSPDEAREYFRRKAALERQKIRDRRYRTSRGGLS